MTDREARDELLEARRIMCATGSAERMLEVVIPALGWLLVNCPDSLASLVRAHIYEAERRAAYLPWRPARPTGGEA